MDNSNYENDLKNMSAGGIIFDKITRTFLLVRGPIKWSFPKGHGKKGETHVQCAIREVKEETNLDITFSINEQNYIPCLGTKLYIIVVDKSLLNWKINDNCEISDINWFSIGDITKMWEHCNALIKNFVISGKYKYHVFNGI